MANGDVQNKVTSWQTHPSDSNVPSEKLVKYSLDTHEQDADSVYVYYHNSSGTLIRQRLDLYLDYIVSLIPSHNPVTDTETGLNTILTYIDTNWEDY